MIDKELLAKKKTFQKTKNLLSQIGGIKVLEYEEQIILQHDKLQKMGFYDSAKLPDAAIWYLAKEQEIIEWIISLLYLKSNDIYRIWLGDYLVKIRLTDVREAVCDLWNKIEPRAKGFILLSEDKKTMHDFGLDSRDEYRISYDRYDVSIQS